MRKDKGKGRGRDWRQAQGNGKGKAGKAGGGKAWQLQRGRSRSFQKAGGNGAHRDSLGYAGVAGTQWETAFGRGALVSWMRKETKKLTKKKLEDSGKWEAWRRYEASGNKAN